MNEEEKEVVKFFKEFNPKKYWRNPIKLGNYWVMEDDIELKK